MDWLLGCVGEVFNFLGLMVAQRVKHLPAMQETQVRSLSWEDALEKEMATHSSVLAWRIPWTEEPGGLQSTGSQSRTGLSDFTFTSWYCGCSGEILILGRCLLKYLGITQDVWKNCHDVCTYFFFLHAHSFVYLLFFICVKIFIWLHQVLVLARRIS